MTENILETLENYAEPLLADMGLELVEVQFRREGHGWVLRFFIDKEDGITIDDCAAVSREISAYLDAEDLIEHAYHLEVSSPGLERPLKKLQDFERFSGKKVRVKVHEPLDGQRVFIGTLETVEEKAITLQADGKQVRIEMEQIAKARLSL